MRRKLTCLRSFFLALHQQPHYNPTRNYHAVKLHPLPSNPSSTTSANHSAHFSNISVYKPLLFPATFASSAGGEHNNSDSECGFEIDAEKDEFLDQGVHKGPEFSSADLQTLLDILQTGSVPEKSKKLEQCVVRLTSELVAEVISRTRNDWEAAFTFFLWAGKQQGYEHALHEYHLMISILGKFRKFDTAWGLIDDMRRLSLVTPQTILIMIRKYAAAHDVANAINAFYAHKRFKLDIRMEEFQGMLAALSRYKNVTDAEHLLFCNESEFCLNTKSFNIILNGWCNVIGSMKEGERIWREMEERGVKHDVYSYGSIMSCYAKASKLNLVLKHYNEMKDLHIEPDRKVYNAVIHAFSKGRLLKEARAVMTTMEEKGLRPDAVTYNAFVMPLCKLREFGEAKKVLDEMLERGLSPSIRTYHAFLRMVRTGDEVFELLQKMKMTGCHPCHETYIMLIRKFCRWRQFDNVFRVWDEIRNSGLEPDRSSYIVLIHGLFLNGKLEDANKFYVEMKGKGMLSDPKIDEMLQAWLAEKVDSKGQLADLKEHESNGSTLRQNDRVKAKMNHRGINFLRQPEFRSVIREKDVSFWDP